MLFKFHVRFHLAEGKHKNHWQIKRGKEVTYLDPAQVSLLMKGCVLKNRPTLARRIFEGDNKDVCAWVQCEDVQVLPVLKNLEGLRIEYNPRVAPYWRIEGSPGDNAKLSTIYTENKKLFSEVNHAL